MFNKKHFSAFLAVLSLNTMSVSLAAQNFCCPTDCCPVEECGGKFYIGGFGGQAFSNSPRFTQTGTAFFTEAAGGPLAVDARGSASSASPGFGGVQLGYRLAPSQAFSNWTVTPAAELEAFFFRHTYHAHQINLSDRLPEHDFDNSFPLRAGVYLVNGVFALNSCCLGNFSPYVGGGVGAINLRIRNANSLQVAPLEPGINHFNSDRNDSTWALAAQVKAGVQYTFCDRFHLFAEYRYLYVDSSRFMFGSTSYPGHAATSTWNVDMRSSNYNAYVIGLQIDL